MEEYHKEEIKEEEALKGEWMQKKMRERERERERKKKVELKNEIQACEEEKEDRELKKKKGNGGRRERQRGMSEGMERCVGEDNSNPLEIDQQNAFLSCIVPVQNATTYLETGKEEEEEEKEEEEEEEEEQE